MADFTENDLQRMSSSGIISKSTPVRKITIGIPHIEIKSGQAHLRCNVALGEIEKEIIFSVDEKYADYLCHERGDAYLIGLLSLAMRERCDIVSHVPITKELYHQIETELLPHLTKYSKSLYSPRILAQLDDTPLASEKKTATGCSCGIDSLTAIKNLSETTNACYSVDYLVINNVGAYTANGATSHFRHETNVANAKRFAQFLNKPLIITNSNFAEAFPQDHSLTHIYSSGFAIFMLRKLWHRYYYASSGIEPNLRISLEHNESNDPCTYDTIALPALSISQLRICNESGHCSRFEKTQNLLDYLPAKKLLNVCLQQGAGNCGKCSKCKRTLWTLDALNALDEFIEVFPVHEYRKHRRMYLRELYLSHLDGTQMISEAYAILCKDISTIDKLRVRLKRKLGNTIIWKLISKIYIGTRKINDSNA